MTRSKNCLHLFPFTAFACVWAIALATSNAQADVRLPGFYTDHMVLQCDMEIPVHGWASPNEEITATLDGTSMKTTADDAGKWIVKFPARKPSADPIELKIVGNNEMVLKDILVGEVWLCSGQSNMAWTVQRSSNSAAEIAAANHPLIRHMKVAQTPSNTPLLDLKSKWEICSPETVANFTACGYFMARELHKELNVPIGLINSSWGGTRVEPWTPPSGFERVPELADIYQSVMDRTPGTKGYAKNADRHIEAVEKWLQDSKTKRAGMRAIDPTPVFPAEITQFKSHQDPTMLFNGMIKPLVGFPIRGAIWYQGESNHKESDYAEKKKALIEGWRELWGIGDFPFYFVQIAPFQYGNEAETILPAFWESQARVTEIPNTGMVVINDIATLNDIHPPNKQDVGARLALLALKYNYGKDSLVAESPTMESMEVLDGKLKVNFANAGGGLKTRDEKTPDWFEMIGPGSSGFQPADATIEGDSIVLSSPAVAKPTALRFAWSKIAEPNLTGGSGLPVSAFRAGEVPSFSNRIPGIKDYKLVYEFDMANAAAKIKYDVDNSQSIGDFDRVAYSLELDSASGSQNIFVSMDAFTDDVKKIGVPTLDSAAKFQQSVKSLNVFADVEGITNGSGIQTGNIEFWPNNYSPGNSAKVKGAKARVYDFGDQPGPPANGYGSMQVHNFGQQETLFSFNHWKQGTKADIGIGNSPGDTKDWTFTGNANSYSKKILRVYVRQK